MGQGIAILDRHILKNLKLLGVIDEVPKSLTRKKYMEIEQSMSDFCNRTGVPEEELDLLLWSREAGEIFK
jgi:N-glycosylase/DNA lyase